MKAIVEVAVRACDNCETYSSKQDDIKTCIGCGVTLCDYCGDKMADKRAMSVRNKHNVYNGFRTFKNLKYDFEPPISFCLECLVDTKKHHIKTLLDLCIRKDNLEEKKRQFDKKYSKDMEKVLDQIERKTFGYEQKHLEKHWSPMSHDSFPCSANEAESMNREKEKEKVK